MFKFIYRFFDKLEDRIRGSLSHYPIIYAFIGGVGIVLFWRGVWHTADYFMMLSNSANYDQSSINLSDAIWWDGPVSFLIGTGLLLLTGLFVSDFIGNEIIITGLGGEKKLSEKTEKEVKNEARAIVDIKNEVQEIYRKLDILQGGKG